jgi:hypothetical protein
MMRVCSYVLSLAECSLGNVGFLILIHYFLDLIFNIAKFALFRKMCYNIGTS